MRMFTTLLDGFIYFVKLFDYIFVYTVEHVCFEPFGILSFCFFGDHQLTRITARGWAKHKNTFIRPASLTLFNFGNDPF